jgi:hypothetical protein
MIARSGRIVTIVACAIAVLVGALWYRHARQARAEP